MAGVGDRFIKAGYVDPKPLIEVNGKRIIEYIIEMFDIENDEFVFVINEQHSKDTKMIEILTKSVNHSEIHIIKNHKKGPVYTLKNMDIKDDEEVIVTYCDNPYLWNYNDFKETIKNSDGRIIYSAQYSNDPHAIDISNFETGIYIIEIDNKYKSRQLKFVKI